jgi:hypothetical protein
LRSRGRALALEGGPDEAEAVLVGGGGLGEVPVELGRRRVTLLRRAEDDLVSAFRRDERFEPWDHARLRRRERRPCRQDRAERKRVAVGERGVEPLGGREAPALELGAELGGEQLVSKTLGRVARRRRQGVGEEGLLGLGRAVPENGRVGLLEGVGLGAGQVDGVLQPLGASRG